MVEPVRAWMVKKPDGALILWTCAPDASLPVAEYATRTRTPQEMAENGPARRRPSTERWPEFERAGYRLGPVEIKEVEG